MTSGVGLGLRRDIIDYFIENAVTNPAPDAGPASRPKFVELAPENWMGIGGRWKKALKAIAEKYPLNCHGLSLSIGSPEPLDMEFLGKVKNFLDEWKIEVYSEHLSYSKCDNAHLYDLLPIPFCEEAVKHVSERIKTVQDFLGRKLIIENVSYYTPVDPQMSEIDFVCSILEESDCDMLLDINNVYVNAFNHKYDAKEFLSKLPLERVRYVHMAGHEQKSEDLIIDTHGQPIIDPVFDLFEWTAEKLHPVPVLLERDYNFGEMSELEEEMGRLNDIVERKWGLQYAA